MASGQQLAEKNFQTFTAWLDSRTDENFRKMVGRGILSRKEIAARKSNLALVRQLLHVPDQVQPAPDVKSETALATFMCPHCGAGMVITAILPRQYLIRAPPPLRGAR